MRDVVKGSCLSFEKLLSGFIDFTEAARAVT